MGTARPRPGAAVPSSSLAAAAAPRRGPLLPLPLVVVVGFGLTSALLLLLLSNPAAAFAPPPLPTPTQGRLLFQGRPLVALNHLSRGPEGMAAARSTIAAPSMMLCGSRLLVNRIRRGRQALGAADADAGGDGGGSSELSGPSSSQQQSPSSPGKKGSGRRNRPPVLNKLSAILSRFRTFIRSKLMLKINGRPVLKLTGWHASVAFLFAAFLLTSLLGGAMGGGSSGPAEVPYSDFMKLVKEHGPDVVSRVRVSPERLDFLLNGAPSFTRPVKAHPSLLFFLDKYNVPFFAGAPSSKSLVAFLVLNLLPFAWIFFSLGLGRKFYGDMTGSVGKDARQEGIDRSLSFADVAGIDRAKREVQELVDMLKAPGKYGKLGARLPKGILLAGPPGTGKTLLARVMAAEAGVPFIYCSGSDFVEMYIGRGAARVRALFQRAAKQAPCIIFMDELDTLGKQRSLRLGGSNDEVEQTLNQLLACMDGLDSNKSGVIVIAATNRYEILDDALTRPGRLDRIVRVELPDRAGREAILRVHARKVPLAADVDLGKVAQLTPGLAGADLATLVNEAAIRAVRRNSGEVTMFDLDVAVKDFYRSRGTDAEKNWKRLTGGIFA